MWQLAFCQLYFLFLYAWFVHIAHTFYFTTQKQYSPHANTETMHQQVTTIVVGRHHRGTLNRLIEDKKHETFEAIG